MSACNEVQFTIAKRLVAAEDLIKRRYEQLRDDGWHDDWQEEAAEFLGLPASTHDPECAEMQHGEGAGPCDCKPR